MKKLKIVLTLSCVLTMVLALNSNTLENQTGKSNNNQKTYAAEIVTPGNTIPGVVYPCNDGTPAI